MTSPVPTDHANVTTAVQSTLTTGLNDYNFRDGAFASQFSNTSDPISVLQVLTSSLYLTEAEKNILRPLLSTLILLANTDLTTMPDEKHAKITNSIIKSDGSTGHILDAAQQLFEEDGQKRGLFNTPTLVQATDPEIGEVLFTHAVSTKMNLTVLPQGKAKAGKRLGLGALPRFLASEALRAKDLGTVTPGGTIGEQQRQLQLLTKEGEEN
jgi:hypothetical protein